MTDPFEKMKSEIDASTPRPNADKRAEILARAMENFDNFHDARQGSGSQQRPTTDRRGFAAPISEGIRKMFDTLTSRGGLTATTALVAVGLVIAVPSLNNGPLLFPGADYESPTKEMPLENAPVVVEELAMGDDAMITQDPAPQASRPAFQAEKRQVAPSLRTLSGNGAANGGTAALVAPSMEADLATPTMADTETYANASQNPLKITTHDPVSTFSIDVDTASYAVARSSIKAGRLPPETSVRAEEFINYFAYDYPAPAADEEPFRPSLSLMDTPWNENTQLLHIALQGQLPSVEDRPPLNLVFLVDTSGSMSQANKLPLLKQSLRLMLPQMRAEDEIAIVTYAGSATIALDPTPATEIDRINAALNSLDAGGSTAGADGLRSAYQLAQTMQKDGEVSRVLLATDGDFNVGISDPESLKSFVAKKRDDGAYLSVLGFGRGNLDDATMQALAQNGNGHAAYIDTLAEAQKVLVDQLTGALFPIANDVKIQIEFNPARIAEYRLIGYETRALNREDFKNDRVDAGEIGAGHRVTALYEITPVDSKARLTDPLRYGTETQGNQSDEIGFLAVRYKEPGQSTSQLIEMPITPTVLADPGTEQAFAAAMAGFAQLLRGNTYLGEWGFEEAIDLATSGRGHDRFGYRQEAITLMRLAQSLSK